MAQADDGQAWRKRIEDDWLRAEELAVQRNVSETVTTQMDAAGACDGIRDGGMGFHTSQEQGPWWQVDLGQPTAIARIVVWNRTAAAHRASQIRVLLSDDGASFRQVYQHKDTVFHGFADQKPLVVTLRDESARVVRLALPGAEYLHLDEVEVFGSTDPERNLALAQPADQSSVSPWSVAHRTDPPAVVDWAACTRDTLAVCERLAVELHPPAGSEAGSPRRPSGAVQRAAGGPAEAGAPQDTAPLAAARRDLRQRLDGLPAGTSAQGLFLEARRLQRQLAWRNPLLRDVDALLFTKRAPSSYNHMSDQYLGWWSQPGGGIYLLRGLTTDLPAEECLTGAFTEPGSFLRPALSYDGTKVLFAWCRYYPHLAAEPNKLDKANVPEDAFYHGCRRFRPHRHLALRDVRVDAGGRTRRQHPVLALGLRRPQQHAVHGPVGDQPGRHQRASRLRQPHPRPPLHL